MSKKIRQAGRSTRVAEKIRSRLTEIVALTDQFCEAHLDEEFRTT